MRGLRGIGWLGSVAWFGGVAACTGDPPYPNSSVIVEIEWDGTASQDALGSDKFPMTWSDDGNLYTVFGDGRGFANPPIEMKLSMGWAHVEGSPDAYVAINIRSADETTGDGASGKKGTGVLSIEGVLYLLVANADNSGEQCELWFSSDRAVNWTDVGWNWEEFGDCSFLNFGRDYEGARDEYVYMFSPNTPDSYVETDSYVLARAPKSGIKTESNWEYFSGTASSPAWSSRIADRTPVFTHRGGCNRIDVTYNPGIGRYLMVSRARNRSQGDNPNHFSIYEAAEPWGPWKTVYYTESSLPGMSKMNASSGGWGESQRIPSKWISADGRTIHLVYAGDDSFRIRRAVLTLAEPDNARQPGRRDQE
jgi:hypothetical protein